MVLRRRLRRRFGFPLTVLLVGLGATAVVAFQMRRTVDAQDRERFAAAVDRVHDGIRDRIDTYIAILHAGAGVLGGRAVPTSQDFHAFTGRLQLQDRYPGIQGIGYTARIGPGELSQVVAAQRRSGTPDFHVWPGDPREEYHAILYLQPLDRRNRAAIGYDMFTEPTRRAAMERARDSGRAAATAPLTLVQEIDEIKQPGFLIYVPLYDGGSVPTGVDERRARLRGFVYSPFRAGDLFDGILGRNPRPRAGFELFDGVPSAATLLHRTSVNSGRFTAMRTIDVAGRRWSAAIFSTPALDRSSSLELVPFVIWGGLGITLLLTTLAWLQTWARERAEDSEAAAEEASRRFQQLANSIPQLAWMARPDGWIYWYNDRWYEYTGINADQGEGWGWEQAIEPQQLPRVREIWQQSLQSGEPLEVEFPLRGADGQFRVFLARAMPFRDSGGAIVHWFGTNTDVQYRRDAERSLQEHADTLAILNHSGTQLAGELDLDRLIQAVTDAGTRLTRAQFGVFICNSATSGGESSTLFTLSGLPREAFSGLPMPRGTAVFGPTFRGEGIVRSDDITADARYGGQAPHFGLPPGHPAVRSYLAVPVRSRSGAILGGLFFGHAQPGIFTPQSEDIVKGIAAQAAIAIDNARLYGQIQQLLASEREARAEAERVSGLKDEFLATLSHELRTPLNAVVGWAHMLSVGTLNEEKSRNAIDTILRNARIQSQLIEDLLDMSRIISGRVGIEMQTLDIREVIGSAINVVRPTAGAKRISVDVSAGAEPYPVRGDSNRLQQIVWNLLTNAIKFTPPGGRVTVSVNRRADQVEIAIADTGIGIQPEFLPHVFERFRQADGSLTRGHGGLGLGLSIVRSLVEMHAGTVRAESDGTNRGATFTVALPFAHDLAPPEARHEPPAPVPAGAEPAILHALSVLIVDDDADARELTAEILLQHGAHVRTAASGGEALRLLSSGSYRPDLLLSDIGMPNMDGHELIRRVRHLPAARGGMAPAVALTAYAGAEDQTRAIAAGYDLHLAKPFAPAELVAACTTLAKGSAV